MARAKNSRNGRLAEARVTLKEGLVELEKALRHMLQTQALFQQNLAEHNREMAELKRQSDQRFARIEAILLDHSRVLAEHTRILEALPEAICERIGFKIPEPS